MVLNALPIVLFDCSSICLMDPRNQELCIWSECFRWFDFLRRFEGNALGSRPVVEGNVELLLDLVSKGFDEEVGGLPAISGAISDVV